MKLLNEIESYLSNNEFSIEMLNFCRDSFQYGDFTEKDESKFETMITDKVKGCLPELPEQVGKIFAQLCIDRGILEIKDVLFIDGAVFSEKEDYFQEFTVSRMQFIGSFNNYKYSDSSEIFNAFYNDNSINKDIANKIFRKLYKIFQEYFHNCFFPDSFSYLEKNGGFHWVPFAINCDVKELLETCKEGKEFKFNIVSHIYGTNDCTLVELLCSPNSEEVLKILNVKKNDVVRLSNIIKNNDKKIVKTMK